MPRGVKPKRPMKIESVRTIARDDLPRLVQKRNYAATEPQKIRESHHYVARLLALGMTHFEIHKATGYSLSRIGVLAVSPAMQELKTKYAKQIDHSWSEMIHDYQAIATANMVRAERQIADKLDEADEAGETLPIRDLISISRDAADRFGYGKKTTNVNLNIDLAQRMESMRRREAKVIDQPAAPTLKTLGSQPIQGVPPSVPNSSPQAEAPVRPFIARRI